MPSPLIKSFSDKSGKSEKEVEELYKDAEDIVKDRYKDVEKESDRYYALVVGILKNMLKIESFKEFYENNSWIDSGLSNEYFDFLLVFSLPWHL